MIFMFPANAMSIADSNEQENLYEGDVCKAISESFTSTPLLQKRVHHLEELSANFLFSFLEKWSVRLDLYLLNEVSRILI